MLWYDMVRSCQSFRILAQTEAAFILDLEHASIALPLLSHNEVGLIVEM